MRVGFLYDLSVYAGQGSLNMLRSLHYAKTTCVSMATTHEPFATVRGSSAALSVSTLAPR